MDLVEQYPNNLDLGRKVRQFYWEIKESLDSQSDPNQLKIQFPE